MDFRVSCALLFAACFIAQPISASAQTSTRGVPDLKVEANCKATQEIDKSLTEPQSYEACMGDEQTAQQQLGPIWPTTPETIRTQCTAEASAAGIESYVDLLACIQMNGFGQPSAPASALRGASKNRNKKQSG
ncbi:MULTISPECIES: hypothetical protein [Bradyrhizobium]|uniref:hypothetical protein n=1 Tax=Bradyrhizobium TaxID=374 RepID=UPI001BA72F37|nr:MULTISPECIES: hypothetical protein [Bradyrhizobium]MBR0710102.1 hypothetical protein [Bradyrhizobium liaoningense]